MDEGNKKQVNIWDKVAPNFGEIGPRYWNTFGMRLVELSSIRSGAKVLDIGMGRGASLFPAIYKAGKDGYIIGIDNSEVMIDKTYRDILSRNIYNAEVLNMNAEFLDFEQDFFDNIICGFGIGYLLASKSKLNSILKILKKGGEVGFSIWGVQEDQKWLTEIVDKYVSVNFKNENNKKSNSLKFDTVDDMTKILNDSGFSNIRVHEENSDVIYMNKEEWWHEMWTNAVRGIFEQIENLGPDTFGEFRIDVLNGLEKYNKCGRFHFNMPVIYAFGEK